jgi:hypothetical protein
MKNRLSRLFITLALVLLVADLAWVLPRLAPTVLHAALASPGAVLLTGALGLLVAAGLLRSQPRP